MNIQEAIEELNKQNNRNARSINLLTIAQIITSIALILAALVQLK